MRILIVLLLAIVTTHFQISETRHVRQQDDRVCQTQECQDAAEYIKGSMDSSVDPCDDFYEYACGGWKRKNPIPAGSSKHSTFTVLWEQNKQYLREVLEDGISDIEGPSDKLLKMPTDIYRSCMNTKARERVGDAPLRKFIRDLGGWSMGNESTKWDKENWDFNEALQNIHKKFSSVDGPLFTVRVREDYKKSDKHLIEVSQAGPSLAKEIYADKPKVVKAFKRYLIDVAKLLGGGADTARKAQEVIDFETELAKITISESEFWNNVFVSKTIGELKEEAPGFDWLEHLKAVLAPIGIDESEEIGVPSLGYLKEFFKIVKKTPKRVLNNYLVWKVIQDEMKFLTKPYRKARRRYNNKKSGTTGTKKRWRTCMEYTDKMVGDLLGAAYIRKYFDESDKRRALNMIGKIRESFKENVDSLTWMDSKTKTAVHEKVDAMKIEIAFPSYYTDPQKFAEKFAKYNEVKIKKNRFYDNRMTTMKMEHKHMLRKLRKPRDNEMWEITPQSATAFNSFTSNMLMFPAGILQPPFFFSARLPRALSYGAMGQCIAHEITHGFDSLGREFSKDGEKLDKPRWSNSSMERFEEKVKCFVDQYSSYKVGGKYPLNGQLTLDENIADNGGFKAASKAYLRWLKDNEDKTVKLPGVDATDKQLLFLGLAQSLCSNKTPEREHQDTISDLHSDSKFRINGMFQNSHEFSDAFNCRRRSPMNPEKKCVIWSKQGPLDI